MNLKRFVMRTTVVTAIAASAVGIFSGTPAPADVAKAAPMQQTGDLSCTAWKNVGSATTTLWGTSSGYGPTQAKAWVYSGMDDKNDLSSRIEELTMAGMQASPSVTHKNAGGGAREIFGAACAFRDKGDDSALYCFGGSDKVMDEGRGQTYIQRLMAKTGAWEQNVTVAGAFAGRHSAAAAYDSMHDVIWVSGGINNCSFDDVVNQNGCASSNMALGYLSFDPSLKWNTVGVNHNVFGHTMVVDTAGKRLVIHGGSINAKDGRSTTSAVDISDANPDNAKAASLSTTGSGPATFYHGASYDSDLNAMFIYGGVTRNYLKNNESSENRTMALDLAATPAKWVNISGASLQDRIGGTMFYDTKQKASIFTLGRKVLGSGTPTAPDVIVEPTIQRTTHALQCTRAAAVQTNTPVPTNTPGGPTSTAPAATPTRTPPGPVPPSVCPGLERYVPRAAIDYAAANPASIQGYDQLCNPNLPMSPTNGKRSRLGLQNPSAPYHPIFNSVLYKCGCP